MRGKVLTYNDLEGTGLISGDDGQRYPFVRGGLQGVRTVFPGADVDFEIVDGAARNIFVTARSGASGSKDKVVAGLLAFFLGMMGIHKFYLGKTSAGIIMLICGTVGWLLFAIPPLIIGVIALIEAIIYWTKDDQDFQRDYVTGDKSWF